MSDKDETSLWNKNKSLSLEESLRKNKTKQVFGTSRNKSKKTQVAVFGTSRNKSKKKQIVVFGRKYKKKQAVFFGRNKCSSLETICFNGRNKSKKSLRKNKSSSLEETSLETSLWNC